MPKKRNSEPERLVVVVPVVVHAWERTTQPRWRRGLCWSWAVIKGLGRLLALIKLLGE